MQIETILELPYIFSTLIPAVVGGFMIGLIPLLVGTVIRGFISWIMGS